MDETYQLQSCSLLSSKARIRLVLIAKRTSGSSLGVKYETLQWTDSGSKSLIQTDALQMWWSTRWANVDSTIIKHQILCVHLSVLEWIESRNPWNWFFQTWSTQKGCQPNCLWLILGTDVKQRGGKHAGNKSTYSLL